MHVAFQNIFFQRVGALFLPRRWHFLHFTLRNEQCNQVTRTFALLFFFFNKIMISQWLTCCHDMIKTQHFPIGFFFFPLPQSRVYTQWPPLSVIQCFQPSASQKKKGFWEALKWHEWRGGGGGMQSPPMDAALGLNVKANLRHVNAAYGCVCVHRAVVLYKKAQFIVSQVHKKTSCIALW